jgi:hypothetical protein
MNTDPGLAALYGLASHGVGVHPVTGPCKIATYSCRVAAYSCKIAACGCKIPAYSRKITTYTC